MDNGTIVAVPTQGLSNRLRVIATASKLARMSNKNLTVYWEVNKGLNASYKDLFEAPDKIVITKPPLKYQVWLTIALLRFRSLTKALPGLFRFDFVYLDTMVQQVRNGKIDLQQEVDKSKKAFFCSCQEFQYFDAVDYTIFIPKHTLQESINALSRQFNAHTIGVHIRSTDNEWSKKNSPFQLFVEKIEKEIQLNEDVNFFVSTDNETYQNELLKRFGENKILIHKKEFRRDTKKGIEDAVIDIFCLSKTTRIYGSYWSSFSDVAGRIGNIPITVLTNDVIS